MNYSAMMIALCDVHQVYVHDNRPAPTITHGPAAPIYKPCMYNVGIPPVQCQFGQTQNFRPLN